MQITNLQPTYVPKMYVPVSNFEIHHWSYFIFLLITHLFQILFAQGRLYFHELFNFEFLLFFWKFLWLKLSLIFGYETESIFIFVMIF